MLLQPTGVPAAQEEPTCVREPSLPDEVRVREDRTHRGEASGIKALIFDVDGTLYRQGGVRRVMLYRLLRAHLMRPRRGFTTLKALRAYRKAQETLRAHGLDDCDIAEEQLRLACERAGVNAESMAADVARWMEQEPLDLLAGRLREGGMELLGEAKKLGLRLGVFSDYPARPKLAAMGVEKFFDVVVSAQDSEVQKFKPDPRGLRVVLQRLGVKPHEALYVGDRIDVDAVAAARAGMRCVIVGGSRRRGDTETGQLLRMNFQQLTKILCKEIL